MSSQVDRYVDELLARVGIDPLGERMRDVSLAHAEHLKELGPIRVLALDPCPRCGGNVIATSLVAKCTRCDYTVGGGVS